MKHENGTKQSRNRLKNSFNVERAKKGLGETETTETEIQKVHFKKKMVRE